MASRKLSISGILPPLASRRWQQTRSTSALAVQAGMVASLPFRRSNLQSRFPPARSRSLTLSTPSQRLGSPSQSKRDITTKHEVGFHLKRLEPESCNYDLTCFEFTHLPLATPPTPSRSLEIAKLQTSGPFDHRGGKKSGWKKGCSHKTRFSTKKPGCR